MNITFIGADHTVTGSRHLIEINGKKILLDCGLYQGKRSEAEHRNTCFPFNPEELDAVILSHAHIDHSGNLPNLVKKGAQCPIYMTHATKDLCNYMLMDSAYIQEKNIEYLNKKRAKKGEAPKKPLYSAADAEKCLSFFKGKDYYKSFDVVDGVKVTFFDAGHILGSALTLLELHDFETDEKINLLYTGDLGRVHLPILRDPDVDKLPNIDILITESTYGNKLHESIIEAQDELAEIINSTAKKGGKIIIPAFALGRSQEVTYELHKLSDKDRIPAIPIYLDSPLAVNVTEVFKRHPECYDEESRALIEDDSKHNLLGFTNFKQTQSVDESKALNELNGPAIIISSSGMCEHGRILHHIKNNIEDPNSTIMIVGYQAQHTLGRKLVEGDKRIKIFGEPYQVRARVKAMNYFSAHADRSDLLDFATRLKGLKRIFLVHGDTERILALKAAMEENELTHISVPSWGDVYDLSVKEIKDGQPRLRLGCGGGYVYDESGKLATDNKDQLNDDMIPDAHKGDHSTSSEKQPKEKLESKPKVSPQESQDRPKFDDSGF